jgi:general stress protein 26
MPTPQELERKFWKALRADKIMMLGIDGVEDGHVRPMEAQLLADKSPIWFFASRTMVLVQELGKGQRAIATFTAKGHDLFASLKGSLVIDTDRALVDKLWNSHVDAWYDGGRNDPNLVLIRLDAERAEIWESGARIMTGVRTWFGGDPKKDAKGKVAEVSLH